jgi:predicted DNA-binding transcriptional regulator AlpA
MENRTDNVDRVRTTQETAARLRVSLKTLRRMEQRGEGPPRIRITERIYGYRDSEIDKFLSSRTIA